MLRWRAPSDGDGDITRHATILEDLGHQWVHARWSPLREVERVLTGPGFHDNTQICGYMCMDTPNINEIRAETFACFQAHIRCCVGKSGFVGLVSRAGDVRTSLLEGTASTCCSSSS